MAYEDPNAPSQARTLESALTTDSGKKSGRWDWLWPSILAMAIVKLFGLVGGLVTFGCYYWLKPKMGTWGAVAVSGLLGVVVAIGLLAMVRN